ncbi:hypothetical protein HELRODRAFT_114291 [Helobdella robusta]|uniref:TBCC domain-containing protein 1 n=1 Tax=Helobdella robusta TaxID=6412 RepID=T1EG05_HELRO|nr:hypothetical protein HELRODRAFT_114291 [Helobdella robusta]ESN97208.1 hypothetical protein HELRODRAFT_114291 [Helobdella robusta]
MTLARSSGTLCQSAVKISKCNDSFIYLLSPLRSVLIEKCQRSTIILGAVETSVDVNKSEHITVIAATRRFSAQGCKSCNIHLLTPNTPLLFNTNSNITFGPYHTFYPNLEEHMYAAGLAPLPNLWDQPHVLGSSGLDDDKIFEIQKPSDFFTFTIPFQMEGKTKEIPVGLPSKYQKALNQRLQKVEDWHKLMGETSMTSDQKKLLHRTVQAKFQEWLQTTGQARLLQDLVVPQQKAEASSSLQSLDKLSLD